MNLLVLVGGTAAYLLLLLGSIEVGRRSAQEDAERGGKTDEGLSAIQTSFFGLFGLLLAFTFGAAQAHLEWRRQQIVDEGNAIGTAYLRLDLLSPKDRTALRALLRQYVDARMHVYDDLGDHEVTRAAISNAAVLGSQIWDRATAACRKNVATSPTILILPAINSMLDVAASRTEGLETRTAPSIIILLLAMAPISALFAGLAMNAHGRRSSLHVFLYALSVTFTLIVILDLDNPRYGFIHLKQTAARVLGQARDAMTPRGN